MDVLIPDGGSKKGCHLKILAEIDLSKPLLRGTKLRLRDQVVWVRFEYERMATFCFYCGFVGHLEKSCASRLRDVRTGHLSEGQFGDWLRASNITSRSNTPGKPSPAPPAQSPLTELRPSASDTGTPIPCTAHNATSHTGADLEALDGDLPLMSQNTAVSATVQKSDADLGNLSEVPPPLGSSEGALSQSKMVIDPPLA